MCLCLLFPEKKLNAGDWFLNFSYLNAFFHYFLVFYEELYTVHGQVCILTKRPDPERGGVMRWSLPKREICFCQGVVAPVIMKTCSTTEETYAEDDMWFIDDPYELTLRQNWKTDVLDTLLERAEYCGKILLFKGDEMRNILRERDLFYAE